MQDFCRISAHCSPCLPKNIVILVYQYLIFCKLLSFIGLRRLLPKAGPGAASTGITAGTMSGIQRLASLSGPSQTNTIRARQRVGASAFDAAVRNQGATLTMFRMANGHVFGAYVHDELAVDVSLRSGGGGSDGWTAGSHETFLFALGIVHASDQDNAAASRFAPMKLMRHHNGASGHAGDGDSDRCLYQGGCGLHVGGDDLTAFCAYSCRPRLFTRSGTVVRHTSQS